MRLRERKIFLLRVTSHVAKIGRAGMSQSQRPRAHLGLPCRRQGLNDLGSLLLLSQPIAGSYIGNTGAHMGCQPHKQLLYLLCHNASPKEVIITSRHKQQSKNGKHGCVGGKAGPSSK